MSAHVLSPFSCLLHLLLLRSGKSAPQSWLYQVGRIVVLFTYAYLGILVLLLFLENHLLFHPLPASDYWAAPPNGITVQDVELTSADGTPLHAWWSAPAGWKPTDGAVLFCHGNAGNVSCCGWQMADWVVQRHQAVLVFDYPGFGYSRGSPTEAGCYAAADAAYTYLTQVLHVPGKRVLLYGESLGGAIATDLASRRPFRTLILTSTFTSFPDLAQQKYPWLPARWLVRNRFLSIDKIRACSGPIFMGHGTADGLIPYSQGENLFAAANAPKDWFAMPGLGHEAPTPDFYVQCMKFLEETEKRAAAPPVMSEN